MADLAGLGYSSFCVVRIRGALVVPHVTGHTGSIFQVVVSIDMALRTRSRHMLSGQREACGGVIEGGIGP